MHRNTRRSLPMFGLLVAAILLAAPAAHAQEQTTFGGFTTITCGHSHFAQEDPLLNPGPPGTPSAHLHDFVANTSTNASSTVSSLRAGDTTCNVKSDINAIWFPAMIGADGQPIPGKTEYRLINQTTLQQPVTIPPDGLGFIHGNAANTNPNAINKIYACYGPTGPAMTPGTTTIPATCPQGATVIKAAFYNGDGCWNGTQMGPGLGRSDGPANGRDHFLGGSLDCPPPRVKVPRVSTILIWPASAAGGHLSSDDRDMDGDADVPPGITIHVDFVYVSGKDSQARDFFQRVNSECLNQPMKAPNDVSAGECRVNAAGELFRNKDKAVVLDAGSTSPEPPAEVPASAIPIHGFDTGPSHYYSNVVPPYTPPAWQPVPSPARMAPAVDGTNPCPSGSKNLRRYTKAGQYTYATDDTEQQQLVANGWTDQMSLQGLACTVPAGTPASVPLYRLTKTDGDRILTTSGEERDQLVAGGATPATLGDAYPPAPGTQSVAFQSAFGLCGLHATG